MDVQTSFPRVVAVEPLEDKRLSVRFDNGAVKIYDCAPLMSKAAFRPLNDEGLFRSVRPESHGYAVVWNDEIDLAESELWLRGDLQKS